VPNKQNKGDNPSDSTEKPAVPNKGSQATTVPGAPSVELPEEKLWNPSIIGWTNTFLPGGGEFLMGNPFQGSLEAVLELGTFGAGYAMSKLSPFTLDGVPTDYPIAAPSIVGIGEKKRTCVAYDPITGICKTYRHSGRTAAVSNSPIDLSRAAESAFLQEFGLKYHMMNVFGSYQKAFFHNHKLAHFDGQLYDEKGTFGQGIDARTAWEIHLSPFEWRYLSDPFVFGPLLAVLAYVVYDTVSQINAGLAPLQRLNTFTNTLVAFNETVVYPAGSGAPEEMFYRGFLQNEAYRASGSALVAILSSTAAFALSHSPQGHIGASVSGLYLGSLCYFKKGDLGPGVFLHFWSVFALGVEAIWLLKRAEVGTVAQHSRASASASHSSRSFSFSIPFSL
jgi:membrane protease YdiL (CAAX protease family)